MARRLIIDGNAVYELDEECMLKKRESDIKNQKNAGLSAYVNEQDEQKARNRQAK